MSTSIVIITGASRGIGKATAKKFLAEEWKVIGTSTSGKFSFEHENFSGYQLNIANEKSVEDFLKKIEKEKIDVLINNAGVALDSWDTGVNMEKVRKTFEVNLFGLIDFTEKILPNINDGGSIINLSSRFGSFAMPIYDDTSIGYCMSKASLNMYTRFLAFRLKDKNICVSSIHPGWTNTDMGNDAVTEDKKPDTQPEEVAEDIFKLATTQVETGQFWHKGEKMEW